MYERKGNFSLVYNSNTHLYFYNSSKLFSIVKYDKFLKRIESNWQRKLLVKIIEILKKYLL
jgi:hypothetical protein